MGLSIHPGSTALGIQQALNKQTLVYSHNWFISHLSGSNSKNEESRRWVGILTNEALISHCFTITTVYWDYAWRRCEWRVFCLAQKKHKICGDPTQHSHSYRTSQVTEQRCPWLCKPGCKEREKEAEAERERKERKRSAIRYVFEKVSCNQRAQRITEFGAGKDHNFQIYALKSWLRWQMQHPGTHPPWKRKDPPPRPFQQDKVGKPSQPWMLQLPHLWSCCAF